MDIRASIDEETAAMDSTFRFAVGRLGLDPHGSVGKRRACFGVHAKHAAIFSNIQPPVPAIRSSNKYQATYWSSGPRYGSGERVYRSTESQSPGGKPTCGVTVPRRLRRGTIDHSPYFRVATTTRFDAIPARYHAPDLNQVSEYLVGRHCRANSRRPQRFSRWHSN